MRRAETKQRPFKVVLKTPQLSFWAWAGLVSGKNKNQKVIKT